MKRFPRALLLMLVLLLVQACSDENESPEEQIRRFIDAGVEAAEARSVDELGEMLDADFIDQQGNNRHQLGRLLRAYFFRHKNIHLFTRIDSVELLDANRASVGLYVAMAGSAISGVDALPSLRARIYRFELQLVREEAWLVRHASWAPASIGVFD